MTAGTHSLLWRQNGITMTTNVLALLLNSLQLLFRVCLAAWTTLRSLPGDERSFFWGTTDRRVVLQGRQVRRVGSRASGGRGKVVELLLQAVHKTTGCLIGDGRFDGTSWTYVQYLAAVSAFVVMMRACVTGMSQLWKMLSLMMLELWTEHGQIIIEVGST